MTAAKKFDFGNSFDTSENGMVAARDFTMADLEKARAEAFEQGRAAGVEAEKASVEHATVAALTALGDRLSSLAAEFEALKERIEKDSLETVLHIARKLMPHYIKTHGFEEIEGIVRECLSAVYDEPRIVIRARDPVLDRIKEELDRLVSTTGFGGKVVLFADHALPEDHCRVEWADGGAERDVARLWREIESSISRFLTPDSPPPEAIGADSGEPRQ